MPVPSSAAYRQEPASRLAQVPAFHRVPAQVRVLARVPVLARVRVVFPLARAQVPERAVVYPMGSSVPEPTRMLSRNRKR